jgi:hypothetical protein
MSHKTIKGRVIHANITKEGSEFPDYYIIKDDSSEKTYLAHPGDIKSNEKLLYELEKQGKIETFKDEDKVEFEIDNEARPKAMRVRKIS